LIIFLIFKNKSCSINLKKSVKIIYVDKIDDELLEKIEKKPLIFDARKYFEKIS
jgi:hypothetical protein